MEDMFNIFGNIFFIAQHWQNNADKIMMAKVGITTKQWMLLVLLTRVFVNKLPAITEVACAYGTSRQNMKRLALELQKRGFLIIVPDPNDKRIQRLALTGKHVRYFVGEENQKWQSDYVTSLFAGISKNEMASFNHNINKLVERIKEIEK
ncbi:MAG: hypothetical protein JXB17_02640 [Bacteroidales bacterium]|nr:hypothetical protein [Bacteroidales bacterium]